MNNEKKKNLKGKLFISGGGQANKTKKLDGLFFSLIPKIKRMLYIPIAMPTKIYSQGDCFDWVTQVFPKFGVRKIDMWTDLNGRKYSQLEDYGAVYFGGGNTFTLLHHVKKTGFDKLLLHYYNNGGTIYGGSAGAIILGLDIGTASFGGDADENLVKLKDLSGLRLVKNFSIQCHYSSSDDIDAINYVQSTKLNIIALPDETGLYINDDTIKVVGDKSAFVFLKSGKKEYKPKSFIN